MRLPHWTRVSATTGSLLCTVVMTSVTVAAQAPATGTQTRPATPAPAPAPARPATQAPAPAAPARRPAAPAQTARGGVTIAVTDMAGGPLRDIRIQAIGPVERSGTTDGMGQLRITGMPAGTYRLRFTNETVVEFEREVVVRGGPNVEVDVTLRPAPPPVVVTAPAPAPPPAPAPAAAPVGPVGRPQSVTIQSLPNSDFIRNEPRRETLLSCSANTRTTLVQMNQDQAVRLYEAADVTYYVVAGEGTITIDGRAIAVEATSFVSAPRGTRFSIARRGRRPLIMVMQLSGEPCEEAK
jgi:mannose-6-phosphate isomerase-like protein (cupin superfamily)